MELLESRIAPAAIVTFTEPDGDLVTVKTSKGTNDQLAAVLLFTNGVGGKTLDLIDFAPDPITFSLTDLSVTVTGGTGNKLADVGRINAFRDGSPWISLGKVTVQGNLGEIDAGDNSAKNPALKSLVVKSMGLAGVSLAKTLGDGTSELTTVPLFSVEGNVSDVQLQIANAGTLQIGGELIGNGDANSGRIAIFNVKKLIVTGGIVGGGGNNSGSIDLSPGFLNKSGVVNLGGVTGGQGEDSGNLTIMGSLASLTVGKIVGGGGGNSGIVFLRSNAATVTIGTDPEGDAIKGGISNFTGGFMVGNVGLPVATIAKLTVNGNITAGTQQAAGFVRLFANIAQLTVNGVIKGGDAMAAGFLTIFGDTGKLTLGGVSGGSGDFLYGDPYLYGVLGQVNAGNVKTLAITGPISTAGGENAGNLVFNTVGSATIRGMGAGTHLHFSRLGALAVNGDLEGITGNRALITSTAGFGSIKINGDVGFTDILAGASYYNYEPMPGGPSVQIFTITEPDAQIGAVIINGNWTASNLAAGVNASDADLLGNFGDADDAIPPIVLPNDFYLADDPLTPSAIKSIVISGTLNGTVDGMDHFGFIAQQIGSFKQTRPGAQPVGLTKGAFNDITGFTLGTLADITVREIGAV